MAYENMSNDREKSSLYLPYNGKEFDLIKNNLDELQQKTEKYITENEQAISSQKSEFLQQIDEKINILKESIKEYVKSENSIERQTLLKWFLGLLPSIIVAIFAIGAYSIFNLNKEKEDLKQFKEDLKNELLGISKKEIKLELLEKNNQTLENQTLKVDYIEVYKKSGNAGISLKEPFYKYSLSIFVKNKGEGFIDPKNSFSIIYGNVKKFPANNCIDDNDYNNCSIINISENDLITKINKGRTISYGITTTTRERPKPGTTEKTKIKIVYGDSDKDEAVNEFNIEFATNLEFKEVF
jgi:hypothetical protein